MFKGFDIGRKEQRAWLTVQPEIEGREAIKFFMTELPNPVYNDLMDKYEKEASIGLKANEEMSRNAKEYVVRRAIVESSLHDWSGVNDMQGNPIKFDGQTAKQLFQGYPELMTRALELANDLKSNTDEKIEDAVKKSDKSSSGSKDGETIAKIA